MNSFFFSINMYAMTIYRYNYTHDLYLTSFETMKIFKLFICCKFNTLMKGLICLDIILLIVKFVENKFTQHSFFFITQMLFG